MKEKQNIYDSYYIDAFVLASKGDQYQIGRFDMIDQIYRKLFGIDARKKIKKKAEQILLKERY